MDIRFAPVWLLLGTILGPACSQGTAVTRSSIEADRALSHQSADWAAVAPHLPDPTTASPEQLELEGDTLRARRFEADALDYYGYALKRGGDPVRLGNRIGITQLSLHEPDMARATFHRVLSLQPKDAQAWNNLGATEYFAGNQRAAMISYMRAIRLSRRNAIFHSNLATVYFELKDYESAQREFATAFSLDPAVFERSGSGGLEARMLTSTERGRFCFELARIAAQHHDDEAVWRWLRKASDVGYDITYEMGNYAVFSPYQHDPNLRLIVANAHALRGAGRLAAAGPVVPLPD